MEYLTSFQNEGGGFEFNKYHIKWEGEGTNQMDNWEKGKNLSLKSYISMDKKCYCHHVKRNLSFSETSEKKKKHCLLKIYNTII